jgi:preprotein translocase subunit SecE
MAETAVLSKPAQTQSTLPGDQKNFKEKSLGFFSDVAREMKKVSWPTREQLQDATVITLALCFIMSLFVFGVDKIFETILRFIFRLV